MWNNGGAVQNLDVSLWKSWADREWSRVKNKDIKKLFYPNENYTEKYIL